MSRIDDLGAKARARIAARKMARAEMTEYENIDELIKHLGIKEEAPKRTRSTLMSSAYSESMTIDFISKHN